MIFQWYDVNRQLQLDTADAPSLFHWDGPVSRDTIEKWLKRQGWRVPNELVELWTWTGGGEIFEGEEILRPVVTGNEEVFSVEHQNAWYRERGLSDGYLLFHEGIDMSGVQQSNGRIVVFTLRSFQIEETYDTLGEWYLSYLRPLFAKKYRLPKPVVGWNG